MQQRAIIQNNMKDVLLSRTLMWLRCLAWIKMCTDRVSGADCPSGRQHWLFFVFFKNVMWSERSHLDCFRKAAHLWSDFKTRWKQGHWIWIDLKWLICVHQVWCASNLVMGPFISNNLTKSSKVMDSNNNTFQSKQNNPQYTSHHPLKKQKKSIL